jgi:hypothetical protein
LTATNSFVVTVQAVHNGPGLPIQADQTIDVLTPLTVTNTAIDNDIPANTLTYVLAAAPANALISTNGVITWTPVSAQGGTTNLFVTVVTDNGQPPLSATNSFAVVVNPAPVIPAPVIQSITVADGLATVTWSSVSNGIYRLQHCGIPCATNWTDVVPDVPATGPTASATNAINGAAQQFYRVLVVPSP